MISASRRLTLAILPFLAAAFPLAAEDGLLDETFSGDGLLLVGWSAGTVPGRAEAVAASPDGKLLVVGVVEDGNGNGDLGFVRLLASGAVDSTWGALGRKVIPIDAEPGGDDGVEALTVLPDGSAIAAGSALYTFPGAEFPTYRPALVRIDADGDPDPAFGDGGIAVVDLPWPTSDFWLEHPFFQPDGKAIFLGYCNDCPLEGDDRSVLILRVGLDGAPDPSFSGDGWLRESTGMFADFYPYAGAIDAAGRIVVFGSLGPDRAILRLTSSGLVDVTFGGGDGFATFPSPVGMSHPYEFALDLDSGAMYVSYFIASGPDDDFTGVVRFAADGTPDPTFGGDGVAELVYQESVLMQSLLVQSDGKIVLGGYRHDQGTIDREWMMYRLTAAGVPDPTFDGNGRRLVSFDQPSGLYEGLRGMTLSGGRVVAVGQIRVGSVDRFGIARLTSDLVFRDGFERASTGGWGGN